jgi:hypothetical protein
MVSRNELPDGAACKELAPAELLALGVEARGMARCDCLRLLSGSVDKGIRALVFLDALFCYEDVRKEAAPFLQRKVFGGSMICLKRIYNF